MESKNAVPQDAIEMHVPVSFRAWNIGAQWDPPWRWLVLNKDG